MPIGIPRKGEGFADTWMGAMCCAPGCGAKSSHPRYRGLCMTHYWEATVLVRERKATWERLEAAGLAKAIVYPGEEPASDFQARINAATRGEPEPVALPKEVQDGGAGSGAAEGGAEVEGGGADAGGDPGGGEAPPAEHGVAEGDRAPG